MFKYTNQKMFPDKSTFKKIAIEPFKNCPVDKVLKVIAIDNMKTKLGDSVYMTTLTETNEKHMYWIPVGVKNRFESGKVPAYILNNGLVQSKNKKDRYYYDVVVKYQATCTSSWQNEH